MPTTTEPKSRSALRTTRRVLIKAGTSVVANDDGRPSLIRLSAICEQIAELQRNGVEVILVSSGATGMGKRLLRNKSRMNMSIAEVAEQVTNMDLGLSAMSEQEEHSLHMTISLPLLNGTKGEEISKRTFQSACAAGGQFEMMR